MDHAYSVYIGLQFSRDSLLSSLVNFPLDIYLKRFAALCCYWTLYLVVATTTSGFVRQGSYQEVKAYGVGSEIYRVCRLYEISSVIQTCQNNLSFSLYTISSICYIVTTSDEQIKSKIEVSTDLVCCYWTLEIKFNKGYFC